MRRWYNKIKRRYNSRGNYSFYRGAKRIISGKPKKKKYRGVRYNTNIRPVKYYKRKNPNHPRIRKMSDGSYEQKIGDNWFHI